MGFWKDFMRGGLIGAGIRQFGSLIKEEKEDGSFEATKDGLQFTKDVIKEVKHLSSNGKTKMLDK